MIIDNLLGSAIQLNTIDKGRKTAIYVRISTGMQKYISLSPHGRCVACWDCVGVCPKGVLKKMNLIVHKHAIVGRNSSACIGCLKCMKVCKHNVISKNAL